MSALIHDHFNGSLHCVECSGPCLLTGSSLAVTEMVRNLLGYFALHPPMPALIERQLEILLAPDYETFKRRARAEFKTRAREAV